MRSLPGRKNKVAIEADVTGLAPRACPDPREPPGQGRATRNGCPQSLAPESSCQPGVARWSPQRPARL